MARGVIGNITAGGEKHYVASTLYGTCATAAATAAKIVTLTEAITDTTWLQKGMLLCVKFTYTNSVASPTLTIQNLSGTQLIAAKSIMRYGTTAPSTSAATSWTAGAVVPFVYDGTNWIEASSWDNNSTYSALSLGFGYGTCGTAAATAAKAVTLSSGALGANGSIVAVKFTYANTVANPTLNVNSKGAKNIFWKGAALTDTTLIKAGDIVTFMYDGTQYQIIGIDSARATVTQTATSTNANYEILFSETADNTNRTEGTRKNNNLTFNPSTGNLQATTFNNHTIESNVPANAKFTDTTYTANTGIKLNGTTFQHTNSITAGTVGTSSATNGATLEIPYVTYDAQGHITASGIHNHTLGEAAEHDVDFAIDENSAESMNLVTAQAVMELFSSQEEISIGTATPTADNFKLWIQI